MNNIVKRINLSNGKIEKQARPEAQKQFLGGLGIGVRMMADADLTLPALDPGLPFIISVGPLTATGYPGANRTCFFGVSPLTGLTAGSWMGGNFGVGFAKTGTLALSLESKASEPSVVLLREESAEVIPRPDLWGLTVHETRATLQKDYGVDCAAVIGPAGENQVSMAAIRGNGGHSAGRCGMGAILGSKNIKAVVAVGDKRPQAVDPAELKRVNREAMEAIREAPFLSEVQGPIGTNHLVKTVNELEALPTENYRQRQFDKAQNLYGEHLAKTYVVKRTTCPNCTVRCRMHVRIDDQEMEGAEYETVWAFGADNKNDDYALIAKANLLCNDLGLDTMSTGSTIAFYREHSDSFDDPSNILDLIRMIAFREEAGATLANGTREAQKTYGVDYAMQVKGLELAAYDPRKLTGMAISYATTNRGGCHCRAWTVGDEMARPQMTGAEMAKLVADYHNYGSVRDSLITCVFTDAAVMHLHARALSAFLGYEVTDEDLTRIGERIFTLERVLNVRRGVNAALDVLPARIQEGLLDPETFAEGMSAYYQIRDWDSGGRPRREKLAELDISQI